MYRKVIYIIIILILLIAVSAQADEWLVCDPADPAENVTNYDVTVDGNVTTIPVFEVDGAVRLLNVTGVDTADIVVQAINDQGRHSDPVPFDLLAPPSALSGFRIIED